MTPETKVKKDIVVYLDSLGERCWHRPYSNYGGYGIKGVPDRLCCYRGRFFALEVKSGADKKATPWQRREIAAIVAAEGRAAVVWTVAHVQEIVRQIDTAIKFERWPT